MVQIWVIRLKILENAKIFKLKMKYLLKSSSYYETLSWPNENFPKFYNIILKVQNKFVVNKFFKIIKKILKNQLKEKKQKKIILEFVILI